MKFPVTPNPLCFMPHIEVSIPGFLGRTLLGGGVARAGVLHCTAAK